MSARILDGKALADHRRNALAERIRTLAARGTTPCLAAVTVRTDGGWTTYLKGQATACAAAGIRHRVIELSSAADQAVLVEAVEELNLDPTVHGILVQSPLPAGFEQAAIQALISPDKDVEGVGPANLGLVLAGRPALAPCTALAAFALALEAFPDLKGVEATVVGASTIVGKPLAQLLTNAGATVTLCQITTRDTPAHCRTADLLCVAVGRAGLVKADWVKPGAAVIDIGINRLKGPDGKSLVVGDVDPAAAAVAGAITPVPGGVGALTTTILLESTVTAAERLADSRPAVDAQALARLLGVELPPAVAERVALLIGRTGADGAPSGPLDRLLRDGVVVLDGAMGSELIAAGVAPGATARANLDHPDLVLATHRAYLAAGAKVLTANTFLANRFRCNGDRDAACRLMTAGVRLARQAAAGGVPVFASVGPLGPTVGAELATATAEEAYAEIGQAAVDAGADGFALETMPSTAEVACALAALRRLGRPIIASRAFDRDDAGELADFARACESGGAAAIGLNCAAGPRALAAPAARLARLTRLPVMVRPNAGFPTRAQGRAVYHLKPAYLVDQARAYVASGIRLVGGCCGVGPVHIAALAAALNGVKPVSVPSEAPPIAAAAVNLPLHPLLAAAKSGACPIIAAVPARLAPETGADALARLAAAGADAVGYLAGWPGATRGTRLAAKLRHAADAAQRPGVLEIVAADQSLPAAQELLLSAHLLGINLVIVDAGVFASISAAEQANGSDAVAIIDLARRLNAGRDLLGGRIANPTVFTIGVRVREGDQRLAAYAAAGAAFVCLQPVYEPARFRAFLDAYDAQLPLFADLLLLPDLATAEELDNELPGMAVPETLKRRLAADPASDVRGAASFLAHWRGRIAGACVLLPDARTEQAERLLRQTKRVASP
jgi:methylenetetrahydrofolate dehydrogenase (NADP+) / methenyltetrahydrofolate cyclohydrolase